MSRTHGVECPFTDGPCYREGCDGGPCAANKALDTAIRFCEEDLSKDDGAERVDTESVLAELKATRQS